MNVKSQFIIYFIKKFQILIPYSSITTKINTIFFIITHPITTEINNNFFIIKNIRKSYN